MSRRLRARNRFVLCCLLLIGSFLVSACPSRAMDDDRPPIIISSGSVEIWSDLPWVDESSTKYVQKASKSKGVKQYRATSGTCSVEGKTLLVMYGTAELTLERKRAGFLGRHEAEMIFPTGATVSSTQGGKQLTITTNDAIVSVGNKDGVSCPFSGKIEIVQLH